MKKTIYAMACLCLVAATSCTKKDSDPVPAAAAGAPYSGTTPNVLLVARTQNDEVARIIRACTDWNEQVMINDNAAFGAQDAANPDADYWLTGATQNNAVKIWLSGNLYTPANGQWSVRGAALKQYYGKNVVIKIANGQDSMTDTVYVPLPVYASGLYDRDSLLNLVHRTGNTLRWTPDPNNSTGKIVVSYQLYHVAGGAGTSQAVGKKQYLLLDDNGTFNMDPYIDAAANSFDVTFLRGNAVSFQDGDRKVLVGITATDDHSYLILE